MSQWIRSLALALVAAIAIGTATAEANLDANAVGAAVVLPFITTEADAKTYLAVTNAGSESITIEGRILEGNSVAPNFVEYGAPRSGVPERDPNANWGVVDFECPMTPKETILFEVTWAGAAANLEAVGGYACPDFAGNPLFASSATSGGTVLLNVKLEPGLRAQNVLFADWVVVDLVNSLAFGAEGISFQGLAGEDADPGNFAFDGVEFSAFPGALATNFPLPSSGCDLLSSRPCFALLLFTLDGIVGTPPSVPIFVNAYDQFERKLSSGFSFDCWTLAYIRPLSSPGSFVGHMELSPVSVVGRSFHGWIVVRDGPGGTTDARVMAESTTNGPAAHFITN